MIAGRRILIFPQNLSGAGHLVRALEVARSLSPENEVYLANGGLPVPRPQSGTDSVRRLELPPVHRTVDGLDSVAPELSLTECLRKRKEVLRAFVQQTRPDFVLIEHFPFAKWVLYDEFIDLINAARNSNPSVRVICLVRDVLRPVPDDPQHLWKGDVALDVLRTYFDGIFVCSDADFIRIDEFVPWGQRIDIPVKYAGYVSEKAPGTSVASGQPQVLLSSGGDGWLPLVRYAVECWEQVARQIDEFRLTIMLPLHNQERAAELLSGASPRSAITVLPFATDFLTRLHAADLSISQSGYNTATNLLETRKRAILVPHPDRSDQTPRAARFHERGLATMISPQDLTAESLAATICRVLNQPPPQHNIDLNGAANAAAVLGQLAR